MGSAGLATDAVSCKAALPLIGSVLTRPNATLVCPAGIVTVNVPSGFKAVTLAPITALKSAALAPANATVTTCAVLSATSTDKVYDCVEPLGNSAGITTPRLALAVSDSVSGSLMPRNPVALVVAVARSKF